MLNALASGAIIRAPKSGTSASGTRWANTTLRCQAGQDKEGAAISAFVSVVCFGDVADRLARLSVGDAVSVQGPLKPTEYVKDGETRHGLELVAQTLLSPYDLKKKRGGSEAAAKSAPSAQAPDEWGQTYGRPGGRDFDDAIAF